MGIQCWTRYTEAGQIMIEGAGTGENKGTIQKRAMLRKKSYLAPADVFHALLLIANERLTPISSMLVRTAIRQGIQLTHEKGWSTFDQNTPFGHYPSIRFLSNCTSAHIMPGVPFEHFLSTLSVGLWAFCILGYDNGPGPRPKHCTVFSCHMHIL